MILNFISISVVRVSLWLASVAINPPPPLLPPLPPAPTDRNGPQQQSHGPRLHQNCVVNNYHFVCVFFHLVTLVWSRRPD